MTYQIKTIWTIRDKYLGYMGTFRVFDSDNYFISSHDFNTTTLKAVTYMKRNLMFSINQEACNENQ